MSLVELCLSASMDKGAIVLRKDKQLLHCGIIGPRGEHSRNLIPVAKKAIEDNGLSLDDVSVFAADVGPGSYTGIRLALSAIRTLGWLQNAPLVPVVSMDVLAVSAAPSVKANRPFALFLDARRGAMYRCVYEPAVPLAQRTSGPELVSFDNAAEGLSPQTLIVGEVAAACGAFRDFDVLAETPTYDPQALGELILHTETNTVDWKQLTPLYLRKTSAEELWDKRQERG